MYSKNGSPEVLEYRDAPDPTLGPDQVLIRVKAISIEGGDLLNRRLVPPPSFPHIGGYQAAGIIEATGSDVTGLSVGQHVVAFNWAGSHAELFCVPTHYVYSLPESLDFELASTIPVPFGTADDSLFEFGGLAAGETVLIQGAAGGVGIAAVQLAGRAGATVIGTSSSDERLSRLRSLGMDHGINYRSEDIAERALELTGGKGVDLVVDLAGGNAVDDLFKAVRYRGRIAVVGASSGDLPSFGFFDIIRKSLTLAGVSFGREMHLPRVHRMLDGLIDEVATGKLHMPIDRTFPLSEAAAAHWYAEEAHPFGRVLMIP
jgi:NADPH:quinone reductase-like Zn-dependent oxidoreductase